MTRFNPLVSALALSLALLVTACSEPLREPELSLEGVELADLDGNLRPLLDGSGRVRIVNFWATWCAPCREEMPALQALDDMLDDARYQVVGVTVDRDLNLVREFLLKYGIRFSQLSDPAMQLASERVGVRAYPETLLVDETGRVIDRVVGVRPWDDPEFITAFLAPVDDKD
ncbi:TlpA family protein disulfide reductase [Motiliproteus sediminis]|uniref:TlpA family protein disulfide reductase n=1 Tax=Motiliproteus sediminis TaxID=1468178 RepID=UPI001AEFE91D|nr:TlpA disulfide reductase family protein [Motiliproteus sediminis]